MATQKNKLEEVIHLYLGCECQFVFETRSEYPHLKHDLRVGVIGGIKKNGYAKRVEIIMGNGCFHDVAFEEAKLVLRQLSDITAEECVEVFKLCSLFDLSDCEFEFGEGNQWINASIDGRVIDAIQFVGDNIEMMNNDGAFSAINPISPIFHYYLSKGFDLFSLIETGQAIDKNTLQETKN